MKVAVVSLNPAIDLTVLVNQFRLNRVNRAHSFRQYPGGKGINVASFLRDLGLQVAITGFIGTQNSSIYDDLFINKDIEDFCLRIPGMTRTGIKIVNESNQQTTDINLPGLSPSIKELEQIIRIIGQLSQECEWLVMTGSLPPGVPDDIYAQIIKIIRPKNLKSFLDTSGPALKLGLFACPTIAKPNLAELTEISEIPFTSTDISSVVAAGKQLISDDSQIIVISQGEAGALYITRQASLQVKPCNVPVISTVGAGDAMVAGLVAGQVLGFTPTECMQLATACSLTVITRLERHLPGIDSVMQEYGSRITVIPISQ